MEGNEGEEQAEEDSSVHLDLQDVTISQRSRVWGGAFYSVGFRAPLSALVTGEKGVVSLLSSNAGREDSERARCP